MLERYRRQERLGLAALMVCGQHRERAARCGEPQGKLSKTVGSPLLAAPIGSRADRQYRRARSNHPACCPLMARGGPKPRARGRIEIEQTSELAYPVFTRISLCHDLAFARAQQPGE